MKVVTQALVVMMIKSASARAGTGIDSGVAGDLKRRGGGRDELFEDVIGK